MAEKKHITLSFPRDLMDDVKGIVDSKELSGYRNPTEFIVDAVRRRVEYVKEHTKLGKRN